MMKRHFQRGNGASFFTYRTRDVMKEKILG